MQIGKYPLSTFILKNGLIAINKKEIFTFK